MRQIQSARTRAKVKAELAEVSGRRCHAVSELDFDAYQNLTEQIDDLLAELAAMVAV